MVCSTSAAERVRQLAAPSVHVLIDDRALDPRAIEMLSAILVRQNGAGPAVPPISLPRSSGTRTPRRSATPTSVR
jgi:hypothetical protein